MAALIALLLLAAKWPVLFEDEASGKFGFKDAKGKVVIAPTFLAAQPFSKAGVAHVLDDRKWRCISSSGRVLLEDYVFDNGPDYLVEGLSRFRSADGKIGFADDRCRVKIPARWDWAGPFEKGRARVCNGCSPVSDGEHQTMVGGVWAEIDKKGKETPLTGAAP
jgi:hypothetical protein